MFYQANKKETILICVKKCTYVYMHLHIYTNMLLLEKEMATHSNILVWRTPMDKEIGRLQSIGSQRIRHD